MCVARRCSGSGAGSVAQRALPGPRHAISPPRTHRRRVHGRVGVQLIRRRLCSCEGASGAEGRRGSGAQHTCGGVAATWRHASPAPPSAAAPASAIVHNCSESRRHGRRRQGRRPVCGQDPGGGHHLGGCVGVVVGGAGSEWQPRYRRHAASGSWRLATRSSQATCKCGRRRASSACARGCCGEWVRARCRLSAVRRRAE